MSPDGEGAQRLIHQPLPVSLFPQWNRPLLWSLPAASYYKRWESTEKTMKEVGQFPAIFSSSRSTDFYKPGTISFSWGSALTLDFNNKSSLEACSTGLCGKFAIASSPWQLDWSSGTLAKIHKSTLALDSHLFQWDSGREMPLWIWAFIPKILKIWGSLFSTHCPQRLWVIPFVKTNHSFTLLIYKLMELMGT